MSKQNNYNQKPEQELSAEDYQKKYAALSKSVKPGRHARKIRKVFWVYWWKEISC